MNIRDRQKGCMYGLAIGDALGAAVEFKQPGEFEPVAGGLIMVIVGFMLI